MTAHCTYWDKRYADKTDQHTLLCSLSTREWRRSTFDAVIKVLADPDLSLLK